MNPTTKKLYHASVNACLAPLVSVDGKHVITVEGIGDVKNPHPAQERIARGSGSQCGFCTPGIVMVGCFLLQEVRRLTALKSLYALLRNCSLPAELEIEEAFDGNLCRCTGYRPILDAAQTFNKNNASGGSKMKNGGGCCMNNGSEEDHRDCCMERKKEDPYNQPIKRFTPPDFIEYNPDTQLIFPSALTNHKLKPLALGNKRKKWYRPVTLKQLLEIKAEYPSAKIIGGSTETQIEIKFKAMQYAASVYVGDIAELRQYEFKDNYVEVGGNVTLTDLETICSEALQHYGSTRGQPFNAILKQIRYFAGRQIRNVGTPAGNLATASPISDLNPVFFATSTIVVAKTLHGETEIPMSQFFKGYRTTALPPNAIIACLRIPLARARGDYLRAYKQAKRKDDDIAIVNAALRVFLNQSHCVENVLLVYGGMAATTVPAKHAMKYLKGKKWHDPATLEGTMNALGDDFDLRFGVPGGMATYRKSLAFGFFYRFYHEVLSELDIKKLEVDEDVLAEIEREISTGQKDHEATQAYEQRILGKANPHLAALKQCTGEAQYTDDIPVQKNELFGVMVLSTKAHAKIMNVDYAPALEMPGVFEWVDHHDLPNPEANWWGPPACDDMFFATDEVFTAGQPIGMVLADSAKHAEAGARAVIVRYEDLPAIFTTEEAIAKGAYFDHYKYIRKGDVAVAFENADHVFQGVARMGGQEHFYLETQACVVVPKPEDGEMEVFSSTQNATET